VRGLRPWDADPGIELGDHRSRRNRPRQLQRRRDIHRISSCRRACCGQSNARPACHGGQGEPADLYRARELGAESEASSHANPSNGCGTVGRLDARSSGGWDAVSSQSTDGRVCSVAVTITRMMTAKRLLTAYSFRRRSPCKSSADTRHRGSRQWLTDSSGRISPGAYALRWDASRGEGLLSGLRAVRVSCEWSGSREHRDPGAHRGAGARRASSALREVRARRASSALRDVRTRRASNALREVRARRAIRSRRALRSRRAIRVRHVRSCC
jgi:hypothetical protein